MNSELRVKENSRCGLRTSILTIRDVIFPHGDSNNLVYNLFSTALHTHFLMQIYNKEFVCTHKLPALSDCNVDTYVVTEYKYTFIILYQMLI